MRNIRIVLSGVTAMLLMASCNNDNGQTSKATASPDSSNSATVSSSRADDPNINVTITGGDMAGTYSATCKEGCCSWGIAGDNVFGNQYSETGKGPKELSSVQLIVDNITGNTSTKEFTLTVSFGPLFGNGSKSFNINTRKGAKQGSGTLNLKYSGDKASVAISGVSDEGPSIDLKLECDKVTTMKSLGK
jgi:hypothetical protein